MISLPMHFHDQSDLDAALTALAARDPLIGRVAGEAFAPLVRRRPAGFEGLARVVTGQQVSTASADAIWGRVHAAVQPFDAAAFATHPEPGLKAAGLSNAKIRTLKALSHTILERRFDPAALTLLPDEAAHAALVALPGIGPWTAGIYLLFCEGRADIWPAGDLALQVALAGAIGRETRLTAEEAQGLAEAWRPWRGAAAHLFWALYAKRKGRRGAAA